MNVRGDFLGPPHGTTTRALTYFRYLQSTYVRYLQLNQSDVASVRPVFQEARFDNVLPLNTCQILIKQ